MGCAASKLDDNEAVRLCRDRKNFVKKAIKLRNRFASDHIAYIQSLRRVSAALIHYVEAHDHHDFFFNSNLSPLLASGDKTLKSLKSKPKRPTKGTASFVNYLRPGGNPSVSVEESPAPEEIERIESYYPIDHYSGIDYSYPLHWDQLWNPYPSSFDRIIGDDDDDVDGLRQIREEEGIPELEDVDGEENKENLKFWEGETKNENSKAESKHAGVEAGGESAAETNQDFKKVPEVESKSQGSESTTVSEIQGTVGLEGTKSKEETPCYTVYVNRRPISMAEAMKDIEKQFIRICYSTRDVSVMLEASRAQNSHVSRELAVRMMNQVPFIQRTASGSSASRIWQASSTSKEGINGICCMAPVSHQATLDRLYEWEKKLYEEVKAGEPVRIEYEKKCMQLNHHDIYGEEPSAVDQTIAAIRDLHTHFKVYIHTVESISKRIEALRDAELCPQLMKLIQGLSRMWKTMADSHRIQKRIIEDAKLLPFSRSTTNPSKWSHAAAILATEVQNWRRCLTNWINANRSYAGSLAGWASRCASPEAVDCYDPVKMVRDIDAIGNGNALSALSPFRGGEMPPLFGLCRQWSRQLESLNEKRAVEGMEFFAAGMASVSAQQREAERTGMPVPELAAVPEMANTVLCAGMSAAVGSMAEFAGAAAEGYGVLVRKCRGEGRREMRRNVNVKGKMSYQ